MLLGSCVSFPVAVVAAVAVAIRQNHFFNPNKAGLTLINLFFPSITTLARFNSVNSATHASISCLLLTPVGPYWITVLLATVATPCFMQCSISQSSSLAALVCSGERAISPKNRRDSLRCHAAILLAPSKYRLSMLLQLLPLLSLHTANSAARRAALSALLLATSRTSRSAPLSVSSISLSS